MNYATYEISLPDEIAYMYFSADKVNLSLNETLKLTSVLNKISNKWLDEYIVYYFFHDNYYNFLINLNQLLRYIRNSKIGHLLISLKHETITVFLTAINQLLNLQVL